MEHREPPRIGSGDRPTELIALPPTDREVPVRAKWRKLFPNIGYRRTALAVAALIAALMVLISLARLGLRAAVDWLAAQPDYQVQFRDIQLVPGPPDWYRKGTAEFLEGVRLCAEESETLSVLRLERQRIKLSFERSPWIKDVVRVSYPPRAIRVELQYRRPVALVEIAQSRHKYLLDENAQILPLEDVDDDALLRRRSIIRISGPGLVEPSDPLAGRIWTPGPGVHDVSDGNHRIPDAARLASFLVRKLESLGPSHPPALEIRWIIPEHRGLFLWDAKQRCAILWGNTVDEEPISAEERWQMLLAWSQGNPERVDPRTGYWVFTPKGVRLRLYKDQPKVPG